MKKVLVVLLIATFVAAFASADGITFGAWGRSGYAFVNNAVIGTTYDSVKTFPEWAGPGTRVGFNVHGTSANVGFDLNVDSSNNAIGIGDNARVWVKVADFLRFDIGKAQIDNLRGKIGNDWASCLPKYFFNEFGDEDAIFTRFYPSQGVAVSVTPVEGLFIGLSIDSTAQDKFNWQLANPAAYGNVTIASAIGAMQIGAGYTIKDIGQIRAQWIGAGDPNSGKQKVQAAFALTAVKDLTIDIGTTIPMGSYERASVLVAASLNTSGFGLTARIDTEIGQKFGLGAYVDANYNISGPFTAGLKLSFDGTGELGKTGSFGFIPYVKLGYSNGFITAGFTYAIDMASTNPGPAKWAIPVAAEYWF